MIKLKRITFFEVLLVMCFKSFSQEKSFTNSIANFIIKERQFVSKKYGDKVNSINNKASNGLFPSLLKEVSSELKRFLHFTITPKHYIEYRVVDNVFESDTLYSPATIQIKKLIEKA